MNRFRKMRTLQKLSSVHAFVHDLFNQERHRVSRGIYKERWAAALAAWQAVMARCTLGLGSLRSTGDKSPLA